MLSLGLLIPFGAGTVTDRVTQTIADIAAPGPAKHVTLISDGHSETVATHAATAEDLLAERGLVRAPDDFLNVEPLSPLSDGETVAYRPARPLTIVLDGATHTLRSAATDVSALLTQQGVIWDSHDAVTPAPATVLDDDTVVVVRHVDRWTERVRKTLAPPLVKHFAFTLPPGKSQIVEPGRSGLAESLVAVTRSADRRSLRRTVLVSRILRKPKSRILALGVGEYTALTELAERGIVGTLNLANSALSMVATAYTPNCSGCSGRTATGRRAGHGVVAVDPAVIPLGTRMFIPGYGHAVAGDTGGAIRGRRIDLGFNSNGAANRFGRRPVTVYLIK